MTATLAEVRCQYCPRLLFKAVLAPGSVLEMKCSACKTLNRIVVSEPSPSRMKPDGQGGFEDAVDGVVYIGVD